MTEFYYHVQTRDRKDEEPYLIGPTFEALNDARRWARECLKGALRRKYAVVVEYRTESRELPVLDPGEPLGGV